MYLFMQVNILSSSPVVCVRAWLCLQLKRERGKPLRESQYLEVFEDLCNSDWEGYGLKEIDGVTTLSGPGLPAESHMSMMSGGNYAIALVSYEPFLNCTGKEQK